MYKLYHGYVVVMLLLVVMIFHGFDTSPALATGEEVFPYTQQWLVLTGPDDESMITCTMPYAFVLDTEVEWFVNDQLLKSVFLPKGQLHLYESIQDITDLIGDYPKTIKCVVTDTEISRIYMISNVINTAN